MLKFIVHPPIALSMLELDAKDKITAAIKKFLDSDECILIMPPGWTLTVLPSMNSDVTKPVLIVNDPPATT